MSELPEQIADHLKSPRRAGRPAAAVSSGEATNPACGDRLVLHLALDANGRLEPGFEARGCGAVLAVGSLVAERAAGLAPSEARALDLDALVAGLGGLPRHRAHAVRVARRALDAALDALPR